MKNSVTCHQKSFRVSHLVVISLPQVILGKLSEKGLIDSEDHKLEVANLILEALHYLSKRDYASGAALQRDLELNGKVTDSLMKKLRREECLSTDRVPKKGGYKGVR
jgi:hypothetical protein